MCDWQMYLAAELFSPSFLSMLYSLAMFFCFFSKFRFIRKKVRCRSGDVLYLKLGSAAVLMANTNPLLTEFSTHQNLEICLSVAF